MFKSIRLTTLLATALTVLAANQTMAADTVATLDSKAPCEKPAYPRASLVNEEKGTVILGFLVAVDGHVVESKIEKTSGYKNLDKAAMNSLNQCKFKPATKDGKPDQAWTKVEYTWKLD